MVGAGWRGDDGVCVCFCYSHVFGSFLYDSSRKKKNSVIYGRDLLLCILRSSIHFEVTTSMYLVIFNFDCPLKANSDNKNNGNPKTRLNSTVYES